MLCQNHVEVSEGVRRCARCGTPYCPDCLVEIEGRPYCATCKSERLLDVRSGVDRASMRFASVWRRFAAIFLDGLLISAPIYLIGIFVAFAISEQQGQPDPLLMNFIGLPVALVQFLYEGLMLSLRNGQTVGKNAVRVRVVRADGSPITKGQAWGRAALKLVFSCLSCLAYLPAFFTAERTTLHDMVAGTRVIESD